MYFQNGFTQMGPYSVIVQLSPVIKEIFALRCHSFKIELEGRNFQGMSQIYQKITVPVCKANFQHFHKMPNYHPTLKGTFSLKILFLSPPELEFRRLRKTK